MHSRRKLISGGALSIGSIDKLGQNGKNEILYDYWITYLRPKKQQGQCDKFNIFIYLSYDLVNL